MAQWIAAARADEVKPEDVVGFDHAGRDYALFRSPEDTFHATDGTCTHAAASLCDGVVLGGTVECPKHGGRFDYRTGRGVAPPAFRALRTYPTRVENGTVYVELD